MHGDRSCDPENDWYFQRRNEQDKQERSGWQKISTAPKDKYILARVRGMVPVVAKYSTHLGGWAFPSWLEGDAEHDTFLDGYAESEFIAHKFTWSPDEWHEIP